MLPVARAALGSQVGNGAVGQLARRPSLWPEAFATLQALAPDGWWRRWPPLPLAGQRYLGYRSETMYGPGGGRLSGEELTAYVQWCRRMRSFAR